MRRLFAIVGLLASGLLAFMALVLMAPLLAIMRRSDPKPDQPEHDDRK